MTESLRCVIYLMSSDVDAHNDPAKQDGVLARQEANCRAVVGQCGGSVIEVITDSKHAGGTMRRPGIARITQLAKAGKVDVVVADTLHHLTRNYKEIAGWIELVLKPAGVQIELCVGSIDTTTSAEWFSTAMQGLEKDYYRKQLSEAVKNGIANKRNSALQNGELPSASGNSGGRT